LPVIVLLFFFFIIILNAFVLFSLYISSPPFSPRCSNAPPSEYLDDILTLRPTESKSPQPLILAVIIF
jgi:hypothetical protein